MGVICFGSLKGGVGKTSLSVNVAHAFAERGCETLLIDLDPMGHASRFFRVANGHDAETIESPLARLFLACELEDEKRKLGGIVEAAIAAKVPLIHPVRERYALLPAGPELRHFLWGRGARLFKNFFPRMIEELHCSYDYIIIDTPPDFNVLTRNAIAASELVVVPVDSSAMSIHCLEEIITSAAHIKGPTWSICRSMVTKQASRMQKLTSQRLQENLALKSPGVSQTEDEQIIEEDISQPENFISLIERREAARAKESTSERNDAAPELGGPIYLLNSVIYRSEQQNKNTFLGKTAFDAKSDSNLREHYGAVARELDYILSLSADSDPLLDVNQDFPMNIGIQ